MNRSDILVPVNLEKHLFEGLEFASRMSGEIPLRATLLYVVELNIFPFERRVYDEVCLEYRQRLRVLAQCFFDDQPRLCVRFGKAHREIIAEADESGPGLIVMAVPKTPRRRRLFRADTAERVARDAPCPTLVLSNLQDVTFGQRRRSYTQGEEIAVSLTA
jgi:nucleotide-binding universal stress UspA family protein